MSENKSTKNAKVKDKHRDASVCIQRVYFAKFRQYIFYFLINFCKILHFFSNFSSYYMTENKVIFWKKNCKNFLIKNIKKIVKKIVNPRAKNRKILRILLAKIRENKGQNFQIEPSQKIDSFMIEIWIIFCQFF